MADSNICECGHPICGTSLSEHHGPYGCLHVVGPDPNSDGNVLCSCNRSNDTPHRIVFDESGRASRIYGAEASNGDFNFNDGDVSFLRALKISL